MHFRLLYLSYFVLGVSIQCCKSQPLTIVPLDMLNVIDTLKDERGIAINRADYYLIKGYKPNKNALQLIDSFAASKRNSVSEEYAHYDICFYKESKQTTIKNILENPKITAIYSLQHDLIYDYSWINGKFVTRYRFRNGAMIEPKGKITLEPPPKE
jgi:hypothetical protein